MDYLNNWCGNLSVWCGKRYFNTDKYESIEVENCKQLLNGIEVSMDNNAIDTQNINKRNSQIDNINDAVDNLLNAVKVNSWQDMVNQIKQQTLTNNSKQNSNNGLSQQELSAYFKSEFSLSQIEILSFCGKLLDILKTGNIPLQDQSDKYEYLKQYFEVKSKIAKIQNILLVREILNRKDNNNKDNETAFYENNDQKLNEQQEELELVIKANYLAFQSSIEDYKQLKKEIDDIKSQLKNTTNNDAINENNINNNTYDINEDDIITKLKDIESKISTNKFEQKESTLKNNNNQFWEDVDKKTLEIQKHLLTKQLELCYLENGIKQQIDSFIDIFFYIEKDGQLNEFEIEKKNIKDSINDIGVKYLSKMHSLIQNDEDLNKDFETQIEESMRQNIEYINKTKY